MRLGMEIPKTHFEEISRLTDFDFALAHRVMEDREYRDSMLAQKDSGRTIILDNGFHERGSEAQPQQVLDAFHILQPDIVISPDRIDDSGYTMFHLQWSLDSFGEKTAAVIVGDDEGTRLGLLDYYMAKHVRTLCFPYRRNRREWITEFDELSFAWDDRFEVHCLGMQTLEEAQWLANRFPNGSFDTSKPLKWAYKKQRLDSLTSLRGGWHDYDSFLDASQMDPDQSLVALYNIGLLRKALA